MSPLHFVIAKKLVTTAVVEGKQVMISVAVQTNLWTRPGLIVNHVTNQLKTSLGNYKETLPAGTTEICSRYERGASGTLYDANLREGRRNISARPIAAVISLQYATTGKKLSVSFTFRPNTRSRRRLSHGRLAVGPRQGSRASLRDQVLCSRCIWVMVVW